MDIDNHGLEDDLKALEHRLAGWRPAAGGLDRDRMLYDSGRASVSGEGHIRSWRMATAALLFLTVAMGGLLLLQRSLLVRERALLALERSQRHATETALVGRTGASEPTPSAPSPTPAGTTIEPLSPTSYFALTARLSRDVRDLSSPDPVIEPGPHRPATEPAETLHPRLLGPRDVQRILDF